MLLFLAEGVPSHNASEVRGAADPSGNGQDMCESRGYYRDEEPQDRHYYQQFDESETALTVPAGLHCGYSGTLAVSACRAVSHFVITLLIIPVGRGWFNVC